MLALFAHTWLIVSEFLRAPFDAVLGRTRRRYTVSVPVDAPKPVTWAIASAHSLRLEGAPPIEIKTEPDPDRPGVYAGALTIGERSLPMVYRVLEERPGEAMSLAVIKSESAPECSPGDDYVCAFAVTGDDAQSVITSTYELTHTRFTSRLLMPFAAVQNIRRLKLNAELRAGVARNGASEQIRNAALTGLLTFASFFALFGLADAAMLIVVILIHELGHVVAMRWAGIPVKGIYFVPFFGGVAVAADRYRSEAEKGLVALMGPGFSLATTVLLWSLATSGNSDWVRSLAFMSALINGFNLLPILPLDGGHVVQALVSRFGASSLRVFNVLALLAGAALALALKSFMLLLLLMLVASSGSHRGEGAGKHLPPLSLQQWILLFVAYVATIAFYVMAVGALGADPGLVATPQDAS